MERVIQEKISADHLLYVSLKYTKTTDVMLNLIARWRSMIDVAIDRLLDAAKKKKRIKTTPSIPKQKIDAIRKIYKKDSIVMETIDLYEFFKKVHGMKKEREHEFRKNVTLRVFDDTTPIDIDMDKLKEYSELLERFISNLKQTL